MLTNQIEDKEIISSDVTIFSTSLAYTTDSSQEEHLTFDYLEIHPRVSTRTSINAGSVCIFAYSVNIKLHWNPNLDRLEVYITPLI